jgi:hypothetical protein
MTTYAPVAITTDGVAGTYNAAAAGDKVSGVTSGSGKAFLTVKNGSGSPITLTITPSGNTGYNVALPVKTFTVAGTGEKDIPLLSDYAVASDSYNVALSWSSTTSVTWAAKRI